MKQPDLSMPAPRFKGDPEATRQMAAYTAKLQNMLRDLYSKIGTIEVVASAPALTQLGEVGQPDGSMRSDVKILDDATQSNRKMYYRYKDTLRLIDSA